MNQEVLDMLQSGSIPYRYEPDTASLAYFGLAVMLIVFVFAIAQAVTLRFLK